MATETPKTGLALKIDNIMKKREVRMALTAGVVIFAIYYIFLSGDDENRSLAERRQDNSVTTSVFGLTDSMDNIEKQDIGLAMETLKREYRDQDKEFQQREKERQEEMAALRMENQRIQETVFEMSNMMRRLDSVRASDAQEVGGRSNQRRVQGDDIPVQTTQQPNVFMRPNNEIVTQAPITFDNNIIRTVTQRRVTEVKQSGEVEVRDVSVNTLSSNTQNVNDRTASAQARTASATSENRDNEAGEYTLTMGSIISGTTLNGVAAPTSARNTNNPIPIMMRIKKEAIMPNHFTLDIRECHMLGSAVGNLADSRVYIRAEGISCITESGKAIEKSVNAFAVSEQDGLAGVRGEVIFRGTDMMTNTMWAGFLSGVSQAAAPKQVSSLNTEPSVEQLWQTQNVSRYAASGVLQGASNVGERIADYYMDMVDQMHPVIEILPGTQIDFLVQKGMTLNLDGL